MFGETTSWRHQIWRHTFTKLAATTSPRSSCYMTLIPRISRHFVPGNAGVIPYTQRVCQLCLSGSYVSTRVGPTGDITQQVVAPCNTADTWIAPGKVLNQSCIGVYAVCTLCVHCVHVVCTLCARYMHAVRKLCVCWGIPTQLLPRSEREQYRWLCYKRENILTNYEERKDVAVKVDAWLGSCWHEQTLRCCGM